MKFCQYYSSSKGNLYTVTANNGKRLILECGVTWKKLQKALSYDLTNIEACMLTHEHADHSKAVNKVMQAGIDVYTSHGTIEALGISHSRRAIAVDPSICSRLILDSFDVAFFESNHDAQEPLYCIVRCDNEFLLFCPDTSHIKHKFNVQFTIIAIECSYDKDILQERVETKDINETLAKRLLTSHMEKQVAMRYIADFCDLSKCREIHLLHMSGDNLNKKQTRKEFEDNFFIETICS